MVEWLDSMLQQAGLAGLAIVFAAAALEYLFPPFPGDTVTVFGGVYAVRAGLPIPLVFGVLMSGSLAGAAIDYAIGSWVGRRVAAEPHEKRHLRFIKHDQVVAWEERFRHRAVWWLALNRFMPGVRGPIFFAAGLSGVPIARVLLWGGVSSVAWNAVLFAAGYAVGGEAERLEHIVTTYSRAAAVVLLAAVVLWGAYYLWRKRARRLPG